MDKILTCNDCLFFNTKHCADRQQADTDSQSEMCLSGLINDELYKLCQQGR